MTAPTTATTITTSLDAIAADHPLLTADAALAAYSAAAPTIGSPTTDQRLPGGTGRISLDADARTLLHFWCHLVLDERSDHFQLGSAHLDATDVPGMCAWLRPHAGWLAEHPAGPDAADELDRLARDLAAIVAPAGVRRPIVGACPAPDCPGVIRARIGATDEAARDLVCDVTPDHAWDQSQWRWLGRLLGQTEPERMPARDLAEWMSARFKRRITQHMIHNWSHRYPLTIATDPDGTYDRIAVATWYIERRAAA